MKIAIYGGTFDPVHRGHLEVARAAAVEFALDRVLFVPAGHPPHRRRLPGADFEHRFQMVELVCGGDPRFLASRLESPENEAQRHYSIDTVLQVKAELAPGDRLFFVIGSDAFAEVTSWYRWRDLVEAVEFIVVSRAGDDPPQNPPPEGARVHWLRSVNIPISSTEIRGRLAQGESVDQWLAPEVAGYIREHGLYSGEAMPAR